MYLLSLSFMHDWVTMANQIVTLAIKEIREPYPPNIFKRIKYISNGFLSNKSYLYDFKNNDRNLYLTDYQRYVKTIGLNGKYRMILDQKMIFDNLMASHQKYLLKNYATIKNGRLIGFNLPLDIDPIEWLADKLTDGNGVVLKPQEGGEGTGINVLFLQNGKFVLNNKLQDESQLRNFIKSLDMYSIQPFLRQMEYADKIFPQILNTIRVLTLKDNTSGKASIISAIHRFGTEKSFPTDNLTTGGVSTNINLETGEMGKLAVNEKNMLRWEDCHPETGALVNGVKVENWVAIKRDLVELAENFPFCDYIGWDIVPGRDSFMIIEANSNTGCTIFQMHQPLLKNDDLKAYYKKRKVL